MIGSRSFYFGKASVDQIRGSGWFVGQFVPAELGLRHQTDVEVKWGVHPDGDRRPRGPDANPNATTISVLIHGTLRVTFETAGGEPQTVTLENKGDYVIFGSDIVDSCEAVVHTVLVAVRFPSVKVTRRAIAH